MISSGRAALEQNRLPSDYQVPRWSGQLHKADLAVCCIKATDGVHTSKPFEQPMTACLGVVLSASGEPAAQSYYALSSLMSSVTACRPRRLRSSHAENQARRPHYCSTGRTDLPPEAELIPAKPTNKRRTYLNCHHRKLKAGVDFRLVASFPGMFLPRTFVHVDYCSFLWRNSKTLIPPF